MNSTVSYTPLTPLILWWIRNRDQDWELVFGHEYAAPVWTMPPIKFKQTNPVHATIVTCVLISQNSTQSISIYSYTKEAEKTSNIKRVVFIMEKPKTNWTICKLYYTFIFKRQNWHLIPTPGSLGYFGGAGAVEGFHEYGAYKKDMRRQKARHRRAPGKYSGVSSA